MKWATLVVMSVSLAAAAVPRRVLWDEFDVVRCRGEEAFVVGSNDDELMLFNPNGADRVHWSVSRDDRAIVDTGETRKLFEQAGD